MKNLIIEKIEDIDVSDMSEIKIEFLDGSEIYIGSEDFLKIIKFIYINTGKLVFSPGELNDIGNLIIDNFIEAKSDYKIKHLNKFIEIGGKIIGFENNIIVNNYTSNKGIVDDSAYGTPTLLSILSIGKVLLFILLSIILFIGVFYAICGGMFSSNYGVFDLIITLVVALIIFLILIRTLLHK